MHLKVQGRQPCQVRPPRPFCNRSTQQHGPLDLSKFQARKRVQILHHEPEPQTGYAQHNDKAHGERGRLPCGAVHCCHAGVTDGPQQNNCIILPNISWYGFSYCSNLNFKLPTFRRKWGPSWFQIVSWYPNWYDMLFRHLWGYFFWFLRVFIINTQ